MTASERRGTPRQSPDRLHRDGPGPRTGIPPCSEAPGLCWPRVRVRTRSWRLESSREPRPSAAPQLLWQRRSVVSWGLHLNDFGLAVCVGHHLELIGAGDKDRVPLARGVRTFLVLHFDRSPPHENELLALLINLGAKCLLLF